MMCYSQIFRLGAAILSCVFCCVSLGYGALGKQEYLTDYDQCVDLIKFRHSNRYVYVSEEAFDTFVAERRAEIGEGTTLGEFYNLIAETISFLQCLHSGTSLPENQVFDRFLPLTTYFDGEALWVVKGHESASNIPKGSQILEINGEPLSVILENLRKHVNVDGNIESGIRIRLSDDFHDLYARHYAYPESFEVRYRRPNQTRVTQTIVDAVSEDKRQFGRGSVWPTTTGDWGLDFRLLSGDEIGVMTIKHFGYYDKRSFFYDFVEDAFAQLKEKKTKHLILDLRRNGGGDPVVANRLLSYLASDSYTYFDQGIGYNALKQLTEPNQDRFTGEVYLLVDGKIGSTSGHLTSLVRYLNLGAFVGEGTGATYFCAGNSSKSILRNSRIEIRLGQGAFSTAVEGLARGKAIEPNLPFSPSIEQVTADLDGVMDFALNHIEQFSLIAEPSEGGVVGRVFGELNEFTAVPNPGYIFERWKELPLEESSPLTIDRSLQELSTLTAVFRKDQADNDGDGVSNYLEEAKFYSDAEESDSDSDGIDDGDEAKLVLLGFDPTVDDRTKLAALVTNAGVISSIVGDEVAENPFNEVSIRGLVLAPDSDGQFTVSFRVQLLEDGTTWVDASEVLEMNLDVPENGKRFVRLKADRF